MPLLDDLRGQRATARTAADTILERAAAEGRDHLAPEELADYQAQVTAEREANDAWSGSTPASSRKCGRWPPAAEGRP